MPSLAAPFLLPVAAVWPAQVHAQSDTASQQQPEATKPAAEAGILPITDYSGDLLDREYLTGDWGGTRQDWANHGFTFNIDWIQVGQGVTSGGFDKGWEYMGGLDYMIKFDLMRMGVMEGALVSFRAQSRYGNSVNGMTGLLLPVNMEAFPPITTPADEDILVTVTELSYLQFVSAELGFLLGKIQTLDSDPNEFASGRGQTQFLNYQFMFASVTAICTPYSTLAVGAVWLPSPTVKLSSILMNTTDSSTTSGFDDIGDGATWATELDTQHRLGDLPGGMNLGFEYAFDGDFTEIGGFFIDPGVGPGFSSQDDTWLLYWSSWQYLWAKDAGASKGPIQAGDGRPDLQGVGIFSRLGFADQDTNPISWTGSIGVGGRGLIPSRDEDTYGLGYFYNDLQNPDTLIFNNLEGSSSGLEVFYNIELARSVALTLDAQWLSSTFPNVDDSVVLGVRLAMNF